MPAPTADEPSAAPSASQRTSRSSLRTRWMKVPMVVASLPRVLRPDAADQCQVGVELDADAETVDCEEATTGRRDQLPDHGAVVLEALLRVDVDEDLHAL